MAARPAAPRSWTWTVWRSGPGRLLAALLVVYVLIALGMALLQERLLYHPSPTSVAALSDPLLRPWPSAEDFRGLVAEPDGPAHATAILFHGNAGHVGHRRAYAEALRPLGLRLVLAEYPGYGPRTGALGEASLVGDAERTIALVHERYGGPLLVIGESLGSGVAAAAAARQRDRIDGVVMLTPWDRLANVAAEHYPWLPVRWLLRGRYDSAAHLAGFGKPVLVLVTGRDRVVPPGHGEALFAALGEPRRLLRIEEAGHSDWLRRVDADWWRAVVGFGLGAAPAPP